LPANRDFWWAVAVNTEDRSRASESSDKQILWQWHESYGGDLPPFLALVAYGNRWYLQLIHDPNRNPDNATLTKVRLWGAAITPGTWQRFVVKARKDLAAPNDSYVRVWRNGLRIVDYHGPFGYNVPQTDYAKVGLYKWISASNIWTSSMPARRTWSKGPVQVDDRAGYTWQSIDALLD
jgi:hypothetical protein